MGIQPCVLTFWSYHGAPRRWVWRNYYCTQLECRQLNYHFAHLLYGCWLITVNTSFKKLVGLQNWIPEMKSIKYEGYKQGTYNDFPGASHPHPFPHTLLPFSLPWNLPFLFFSFPHPLANLPLSATLFSLFSPGIIYLGKLWHDCTMPATRWAPHFPLNLHPHVFLLFLLLATLSSPFLASCFISFTPTKQLTCYLTPGPCLLYIYYSFTSFMPHLFPQLPSCSFHHAALL